jgi:CheY-like chemotaxis protein
MPTILLVEDNQLVRDMIVRRLRLEGYTILSANDGSQGWTGGKPLGRSERSP